VKEGKNRKMMMNAQKKRAPEITSNAPTNAPKIQSIKSTAA
jgi:hypothetical protein